MRRTVRSSVVALAAVTGLLTAACGAPSSSSVSAEDLPDSQSELVEMAKKEGEVVLGAGGHTREQAQLLADEFEKKYGIKVKFVRESSGDIAQKVQAQISSNSLGFDVVSMNDEGTLQEWSKEDVLTDPAVDNRDDVIATLAPEGDYLYLPFTWAAMGYSYNGAEIDAGSAPKTWAELADADAKFAVADPESSGAALTFVAAMDEIDADLLPGLSDNEPLISDSALALTQMVSTGEADFGVPGIEADVATARAAGEPMTMGYPEGKIGVLLSFVGTLADAPHPAAARLLTQFQMSEEFQEAQTGIGSRSVLQEAGSPEGAEPIDEDRLVVIGPEELSEQKDDLLSDFDAKVRR